MAELWPVDRAPKHAPNSKHLGNHRGRLEMAKHLRSGLGGAGGTHPTHCGHTLAWHRSQTSPHITPGAKRCGTPRLSSVLLPPGGQEEGEKRGAVQGTDCEG